MSDTKLIDRELAIDKFISMINGISHKRVLRIIGLEKMGKSRLLREFYRISKEQCKVQCTLSDLRSTFQTYDDVLFNLVQQIGAAYFPNYQEIQNKLTLPKTESRIRQFFSGLNINNEQSKEREEQYRRGITSAFMRDIRSMPANIPIVLLFDAFEEADPHIQNWINEQLVSGFVLLPNVYSVLAGRSLPEVPLTWHDQSITYELPPVSFEAHKHYCTRVGINLGDDVIRAFHDAFDGKPGLFAEYTIKYTIKTTIPIESSSEQVIDFVLVTALREERDALLSKLPGYRKLPPSEADIRNYYQAELPVTFPDGSIGTYRIILLSLLNMGRLQAATAAVDAIRRWHPRYILLVGIAGGFAIEGIKLGDILISDQVVDYELQKVTSQGPEVRWEAHRADARLLDASNNLISEAWQKLMSVKRPDRGKAQLHIGPIASGDKVIAFGELLKKYQEVWPKLIGVEMEAGGVATAAFQATDSPGFFMIRCVSDLADEDKGSAGVKKWRPYACDAAASYAIAFLKSGPVHLTENPLLAGPHEIYISTDNNARDSARLF